MESLERRVAETLGIIDPYEERGLLTAPGTGLTKSHVGEN